MTAHSEASQAARDYSASVETRDGELFTIRAIRPEDKKHIKRAFQTISKETVYYRFFEFKSDLTDKELAYLTEVDFVDHVALVATIGPPAAEEGAGVARYVVQRDTDPLRAEAAFAVADRHQNKGIGTQLLYHLADVGRAAGVKVFCGEVLGDNYKMMEVFLHSGFEIERDVESGVIKISFSIEHGSGGPARAFGNTPKRDP